MRLLIRILFLVLMIYATVNAKYAPVLVSIGQRINVQELDLEDYSLNETDAPLMEDSEAETDLPLSPEQTTSGSELTAHTSPTTKATRIPGNWSLVSLYARDPSCPFFMDSPILIAATVFSNTVIVSQYTGYKCYSVTEHWIRKQGRLQVPFNELNTTNFISLSIDECLYMVKHLYTPTRLMTPLHRLNDTSFGTNVILRVNQSSLYDSAPSTYNVTNYYLAKVNLTLNSTTIYVFGCTKNG